MAYIYHILDCNDWETAKKNNTYHPVSLENEGFIHCSRTDQLQKVANSFYKGQTNLIIIRIEEDKVGPKVVHEPPLEAPMSGVLFPHIYGDLNIDSVDKEIEFPCNEDGTFQLPEELLGE